MTFARAMRWSLIAAPVLAGVALLIFGTAGGISTAFGLTLIGIGAIVWMWNWFLRMAFDEEAGKQAAREQARRDREPPPKVEPPAPVPETSRPPTLHQHPSSVAPHEQQHERTVRRPRRRRPQ